MDVFKFVFDVAKDQSSNTPNCADLISQKTFMLDSLQFSNDELLFLDIFPNYENNNTIELDQPCSIVFYDNMTVKDSKGNDCEYY